MNQTTFPPFSRQNAIFRRFSTPLPLGLLCGALFWSSEPLAAQTPAADGNLWITQSLDIAGTVRIGASSLENAFLTVSSSGDLWQYNSVSGEWEVSETWAEHFATSGGWSGALTSVAVSGSTIYVGGIVNQLGYSTDGGQTWSNISLTHRFGGDRMVAGIYTTGTQAYVLRQNGSTNLVVNGVEVPLDNSVPMGNTTFQNEGAKGIVGIGDHIWITNNANSTGDPANTVRGSTTFGVGTNAWSSGVTATGGGNFGGLFALNEETLFKAGGNDTIGVSTDGGASFSTLTLGMDAGTTRSVYGTEEGYLWVTSNVGLFYYDGEIWQDLTSNLIGYAGESLRGIYEADGYLWVTGNAGGIWMAVPEPSTVGLVGFAVAAAVAGSLRRRNGKMAL